MNRTCRRNQKEEGKKESEGRRKKEEGRIVCWFKQAIKTLELQSFLEL
ncbi:hypothetical protein QUA81_19025 [Microcoleus sp. F6_B4]